MKKIFEFTLKLGHGVLILFCAVAAEAFAQAAGSPHELPVQYVLLGNGKFSPANIDHASKIAYVWEDVILARDQVPNVQPQHRMPTIDPQKGGWTIKKGTPPVYYLAAEKTIRFGFYDQSARIFYRWKDLHVAEDAVPKRFEKWKMHTKAGGSAEILSVVDIDIPQRILDSFLTEFQKNVSKEESVAP